MRKLILGVILATTILWTGSSAAQERPKLGILIESLSEGAATCGINKSSLELIAALTLRNNGVQVEPKPGNPYLYVQVSTLATPSGVCFTNTTVFINFLESAPTGRFKPKGGGRVTANLCMQGAQDFSPASSHSKIINDTLEQGIKLCLGALDY